MPQLLRVGGRKPPAPRLNIPRGQRYAPVPKKFGPTSGPWMKPGKKPYNWAGAANVNWFPGLTAQNAPAVGAALGGMLGLTPPPPSGGGGGGGGGGGAYPGLIAGDWEVQDAEAAMAARLAGLRSDFQTNLRQALIDLGVTDPGKLGTLGKYIDAETIQKAAANKYSQTATIGAGELRAQRMAGRALAARGGLSSGQTTKTLADVAAGAESQRYQALRDFLATGSSGLRGIADEEYQLARGVAQARAAAAARAAEQYQIAGMGSPEEFAGGFAPGAAPEEFAPAFAAYGGGGRPALRPGFVRGTGGQYMTRQAFQRTRPQGNYQNYLNYLRRHRGGRL